MGAFFTEADIAALGGSWSWLAAVAGQPMQQGNEWCLEDALAGVQPWGFRPDAIRVPVLITHGAEYKMVPCAHGEWLAARAATRRASRSRLLRRSPREPDRNLVRARSLPGAGTVILGLDERRGFQSVAVSICGNEAPPRADPGAQPLFSHKVGMTSEPSRTPSDARVTPLGGLASAVVVVSGLDDDELLVRGAVDETVLVVDPPGPEAGEVAAQRFWLASALERGPPGFLDEP